MVIAKNPRRPKALVSARRRARGTGTAAIIAAAGVGLGLGFVRLTLAWTESAQTNRALTDSRHTYAVIICLGLCALLLVSAAAVAVWHAMRWSATTRRPRRRRSQP